MYSGLMKARAHAKTIKRKEKCEETEQVGGKARTKDVENFELEKKIFSLSGMSSNVSTHGRQSFKLSGHHSRIKPDG